MKTKTALTLWLFGIGFLPAVAQNQLSVDAFEEFSTSRLWEFEEIPIDWKMEGSVSHFLSDSGQC